MSQLYAYMSQPKLQLETFRAWAGKSSDISYYLVRRRLRGLLRTPAALCH